MEDKDKTS